MDLNKVIIYVILIIFLLIFLFSILYNIKPYKTLCISDKSENNLEWNLEDEIKKFTDIEDMYIKK